MSDTFAVPLVAVVVMAALASPALILAWDPVKVIEFVPDQLLLYPRVKPVVVLIDTVPRLVANVAWRVLTVSPEMLSPVRGVVAFNGTRELVADTTDKVPDAPADGRGPTSAARSPSTTVTAASGNLGRYRRERVRLLAVVLAGWEQVVDTWSL